MDEILSCEKIGCEHLPPSRRARHAVDNLTIRDKSGRRVLDELQVPNTQGRNHSIKLPATCISPQRPTEIPIVGHCDSHCGCIRIFLGHNDSKFSEIVQLSLCTRLMRQQTPHVCCCPERRPFQQRICSIPTVRLV
jgi:hypothetical protein